MTTNESHVVDAEGANATTQDTNLLNNLDRMFSPTAQKETPKGRAARRNQPGLSGEPSERSVSLPPSMQMGATLKLHTHLAINLFRGRRGDRSKNIRQIVGMSLFARQAGLIWTAAKNDDPYADQCLIEIEEAHKRTKTLLDEREKALSELIEGLEGFEVDVQTCTEPLEIPLNFHSPWAYRSVLLLLQYDKIVRLGLTAHHVGFIGDAEWNDVITDSGRAMRNLFEEVNRWVFTNVTRDDIRKNTKVAKRAQGQYLEKKNNRLVIEDEVMEGTKRASIAPRNPDLEKYLSTKRTQHSVPTKHQPSQPETQQDAPENTPSN